jgi:hypothetical protein
MPGLADATPMSMFDLRHPSPSDEPPVPKAEIDLRETFDLPLLSARDAERSHVVSRPEAADAAGLFVDHGARDRRTTAAEARSRARRCITCGGVVAKGMSICGTCGTDQETGMRVGLDDDLAPAPPPPPEGPPMHVATIGGLCVAGCVPLLVLAAVGSVKSQSTAETVAWFLLAVMAIFGVYAAIQFIRGRSARLLILALTLGAVADVMAMIALPIFQAFALDHDQIARPARPDDPDELSMIIKPLEDRIDANKIGIGVGLILVYAVLSTYLISPPVKKFIQSHGDRGP